jgi:hypothetical protein
LSEITRMRPICAFNPVAATESDLMKSMNLAHDLSFSAGSPPARD